MRRRRRKEEEEEEGEEKEKDEEKKEKEKDEEKKEKEVVGLSGEKNESNYFSLRQKIYEGEDMSGVCGEVWML